MRMLPRLIGVLLCASSVLGQLPEAEPPERMQSLSGNFTGQTARPLRYFPDGHGFVITNGAEYFNRPLYCDNSGFRIDGGDRPEFSFYSSGHLGNLRLGVLSGIGTDWLDKSQKVVSRYRPGRLDYVVGNGAMSEEVHLSVLPLADGMGLIGRVRMQGWHAGNPAIVFAFGGVDGMKGRRGGDIGCEREPVSSFFKLRPEQCRGNEISSTGNVFIVRGKGATMAGLIPPSAYCVVAEGKNWNELFRLLPGRGYNLRQSPLQTDTPVVAAVHQEGPESVFHFVIIRAGADLTIEDMVRNYGEDKLPALFEAAEAARRAISERVVVETPDEFINSAAAALNVAADGVWDAKQTSFMHGAVAWRNRLLGWRGAYAGDALGWHERTRQHLEGYAKQQNTNAIPETIPAPEESASLSRNENALHSNGDMSKNHYDMNLVAMDALFRHLLWTGDLEFAKKMWPVIERHLAWERRLFRREFGPDKLPLYEGYCSFWASDDVAYNGGGASYASAYNAYHNKMAARVANLIGKDPTPYEREAELIAKAMRRELWLPERGWFAEYKDWLGLQLVHPNAAAWTFYHTIDSEVPSPQESWQMTRWLETEVAHIPLSGPGVPTGCFTIPTSSWMPYAWSVNNVVMAEATHTSLACWQANRRDLAFPLFKGALLDSMFLGLCPGNVGMCTQFDAYRHESQRDFADGCGATSRALVEGLFGIKPDALAGELVLCPGFPAEWDHADIRHPDLIFNFKRDDLREEFVVRQNFAAPLKVRLQLPMLRERIESVSVNGKDVKWRLMTEVVGGQRVEIEAGGISQIECVVNWAGNAVVPPADFSTQENVAHWREVARSGQRNGKPMSGASTNLESVDISGLFNDKITQIFRNEYLSPRSPFCSLALPKQGIGSWCLPKGTFDVDDSGLREIARKGGGKIQVPHPVLGYKWSFSPGRIQGGRGGRGSDYSEVPFATPGEPGVKNVAFVSQWDNHPREVSVSLGGKARRIFLLMAGSTNPMQTGIDNGEVIVTCADGSTARLPLRNPTTWWPIDQDFFVDDYAFRYDGELPLRVDLKTGKIRVLEMESFKGKGGKVPGGAATVLDLPLDPGKELKSLTVRALANEVVIGLMSVTLAR